MKKFILSILLFLPLSSYSWTLTPHTGRGFQDNNIDIFIADTDCSNAGFSTQQLVTLLGDAIEDYWNAVDTSSLALHNKGIRSDIDIATDTHDTALAKVPNNSILAGCNDNPDNGFDNGSILGSTLMSCNGDNCKAVFILNAHANSNLPNRSDADLRAIIAHEIGHAFGLGHSEYQYNLMYYSISGKYQKWLGMDDIHGVSYLYPHKAEAEILGIPIFGHCAQIDFRDNENNFIASFLAGLLLFAAIALAKNLFNYSRL